VSSEGPPVALITGITGQDGTYLAEELSLRGWDVHGLTRPTSTVPTHLSALPNVQLHRCDMTDLDSVTHAAYSAAPDHVFHLAGASSVWRSWTDPIHTTKVNAMSVVCLLEACLRLQDTEGKRLSFVNASSAEIFAGVPAWPQTEDTPIRPTSPYGASKAFSHLMTQIYRTRGLKTSNAILYSHESPRRPETFVTRKITMAAAAIAKNGQGRLTLGNVDARRDWGWAPDYVRALIMMAEHPDGDDFIIATGRDHSVRDFVRLAFEAASVPDWQQYLHTDGALARVGDAKNLVGDPSKATGVLGWTPTLDLSQIIARMVDQDLALLEVRPTADGAH